MSIRIQDQQQFCYLFLKCKDLVNIKSISRMLTLLLYFLLQSAYLEANNAHISQSFGVPDDFKEGAEPFTKMGSKYYKIEKNYKQNWFGAAMNCREMGGNLANVQSSEEIKALSVHLDKSQRYWVDLTNLADKKQFRSLTTGQLKTTYPVWNNGEPNNVGNVEHCVHLFYNGNGYVVNDFVCDSHYLYICETNYPRTINVVTW